MYFVFFSSTFCNKNHMFSLHWHKKVKWKMNNELKYYIWKWIFYLIYIPSSLFWMCFWRLFYFSFFFFFSFFRYFGFSLQKRKGNHFYAKDAGVERLIKILSFFFSFFFSLGRQDIMSKCIISVGMRLYICDCVLKCVWCIRCFEENE